MSILKKVNGARRAVMRRITKGLGQTRINQGANASNQDVQTILICRPNHRLGNLLLITPLLQDVSETFPNATIDLFVKGGVAPSLFKNFKNIRTIIQLPKKPQRNILKYLGGWIAIQSNRYDIVINAVNHSSSGKISARLANARVKLLGDISDDIRVHHSDHRHMAKYPVYSFRKYVRQLGYRINEGPAPNLDLKLAPEEIAEGKKILDGIVQNTRSTIGIYTYATGAKCYDTAWWADFYSRLQAAFPKYNVIEVLPIENVSQIGFAAPSFYSKDLRQIGSLIANLEIFIGADSGMMHLASASGTPVIGLFKADNMPAYEPYNSSSTGIRTDHVPLVELIQAIDTSLVR